MQLYLNDTFREIWKGLDPFEQIETLQGDVLRAIKNRRTLRFCLNGRGYYIKIHHGVGWVEIVKNLLQGKVPVLGASNEWAALNRLQELGVETMTPVAFGLRGRNPARLRSFIITEELAGTKSLEDLCAEWKSHPPSPSLRRGLIQRIASMVRQMHRHGINHRDCYICHFHLDVSADTDHLRPEDLHLHVIDLHRAQLRRRTPRRWIIKDLGGLHFSAMDIGLTRTDRFRFIRTYEQRSLREVFSRSSRFWRHVEQTARTLYRKLCGASSESP
ncbi:MAG TPA: lipopolysaccharide core heptose(I) kinase RfaP [Sedimentisphaerales bacterium]|nr:lipopolysaccharide core heptose(I) kinase RfaP [Sedimentisphaerales bacterium]HNU29616.1 lipopolysaccharide core heptose(I) kinase RfaP [Sedimentisphaerales bacterium]